jgi:uncharacterized protein
MRRLPSTSYLGFPFRMTSEGPQASGRRAHVREQIAQVLLTLTRERVFRPEFGAGVQRLVFEPNAPPLWELTRKRLMASLIEALQGEVDPRTLDVEIDGRDDVTGLVGETLEIRVRYQLAAIGEREEQSFTLGARVRIDG